MSDCEEVPDSQPDASDDISQTGQLNKRPSNELQSLPASAVSSQDDSGEATVQVASAASTPRRPAAAQAKRTILHCDCRGMVDGAVLVCHGQSHRYARRFHAECVDEDEADWSDPTKYVCERCRQRLKGSRRVPSSQTDTSNESQQSAEYLVQAILDKRIEDGELQYLLKWRGVQGQAYDNEWVAADTVQEGPLKAKFEATGQLAEDSEEDDDGVASAQAASQQPLQLDADEGLVSTNPYWARLKDGYSFVLRAMWLEVSAHASARDLDTFETFRVVGMQILASMPDTVLRAVCSGNMLTRKLCDEELRSALSSIRRKAKKGRPCIYMFEFVDNMGRTPMIWQMQRFIDHARQYLNPVGERDKTLARKIDSVKSELDDEQSRLSKQGWRRYLDSDRSKAKLGTLLDQLQAGVTVLVARGSKMEARMPFALRDIGYSDDGTNRIKSHEKHESSNKMMNLFDAISMADNLLDGLYRPRGDVIYLCWSGEQAIFSEIMFSILAQSYIETGKGFNGHEAGISNSTNRAVLPEAWCEWQVKVETESPFYDNMQAETERVQAYRARHDALNRRIYMINVEKRDGLQRLVTAQDELLANLKGIREKRLLDSSRRTCPRKLVFC